MKLKPWKPPDSLASRTPVTNKEHAMTATFSSHVATTAVNHDERSITVVLRRARGCTITASNLALISDGDEATFKCDLKTETLRGREAQKKEAFDFLQHREHNDAFLQYLRDVARTAGILATTAVEGAPVPKLDEESLANATRRETTWSWA
jgi:hypothetical protein